MFDGRCKACGSVDLSPMNREVQASHNINIVPFRCNSCAFTFSLYTGNSISMLEMYKGVSKEMVKKVKDAIDDN